MRPTILLGLFLFAPIAWAKGEAAPAPAAPTVGQGNMMHCPNSVNGAKTAVREIKDGVEITITADNDKSIAEIRQRAQHLVEAAKTDPNSVRHTGDGHGGGGVGMCPVVLKDTLVAAEEVKGGSKITLRPIKPVDLDWLRKEVASRTKPKK